MMRLLASALFIVPTLLVVWVLEAHSAQIGKAMILCKVDSFDRKTVKVECPGPRWVVFKRTKGHDKIRPGTPYPLEMSLKELSRMANVRTTRLKGAR